MWGLSLGTCLPNLKLVSSAVLELLAFNAPKFRGHVIVTTPTFRKYLSGVMWGPTLVTRLPNLNFEVRTFSRFGTDGQTDGPEEAYLASGRG